MLISTTILDLSDMMDSPSRTEFSKYDQLSDISEHASGSETTHVEAVSGGAWAPWETREVSVIIF